MLTILEGPDCSGKTTLQGQLCPAKEGWVHEHFGPPSLQGAWKDYAQAMRKYWIGSLYNVCVDRFVYGELIYPNIVGRRSTFTRAHARMLERVLLGLEAVTVFCRTSLTTTMDLWRERAAEQEMFKREEPMIQSWIDWGAFIRTDATNIPSVVYDWQRRSLTELRDVINTIRPPMNRGPGVGMFKPGVTLMVGDTPNKHTMLHEDWVFVAEKETSLWLAQQLDDWGINEQSMYWINAKDGKGNLLDPRFIDRLQPGKIIAMGGQAEMWCREAGLAYEKAAHPSFWKRFHAGEPYPLRDLL